MSYFHRGRHRKPTHTGRNVARAAVVGATVLAPVAVSTATASADTLDSIEKCESSGNLRASNGTHFGLYQFDIATWKSVGGSGNPMNASRAEQRSRAEALMARRGTGPWTASQHCWGGGHAMKPAKKSTKPAKDSPPKRAVAASRPERPAAAPKRVAPAPHTRAPEIGRQRPTQRVDSKIDTVTVVTGDTLSGIAARNGENWRTLWTQNRATITNPDKIYPGQRIKV